MTKRSRRELEKALERLSDVVDKTGEEPEVIEIPFQVYELVSDEVSEDNKGELLIEQDITFVQRRDELEDTL